MAHSVPELDGPELPPLHGGPVRRLGVILHGYGADGHDLIALGREWQPHLPGMAFIAPHAPFACAMSPTGHQWFALPEISLEVARTGTLKTLPILDAFLDKQLARHGLEDSDLALIGFSQGAIMALSAGLRRPCSAILAYSGLLAEESPPPPPKAGYPPVLLVHGQQDPVVPPRSLPYSHDLLTSWGISATACNRPNLGHGIDQEGLHLGLECLKKTETGAKITKSK